MVLFLSAVYILTFCSSAAYCEMCKSDQYQCFDGSCIPLRNFCDGDFHCHDKSDEQNCPNECLLRHDLYGEDEVLGYHGNRQITKDGEICTSPCNGYQGRIISCVTETNVTKQCDVPYCNFYESWTSKSCDFTSSFCGWTMLSNADIDSWRSEDTTGEANIFMSGHNFSYIVLSSPILTNARHTDFIRFNCTVRKPQNVYWTTEILHQITKDSEEFPKTLREWTYEDKTHILIQHPMSPYTRQKVYAYFTFYRYGEYNVSIKLSKISIIDHTESLRESGCEEDEFQCGSSPSFCIPAEFAGDGYTDCKNGFDERFSQSEDYLSCDNHQEECPWSGVCISKNSSAFLKEQCQSNRTARPYEILNTTCPNYFECKREFGINELGRAICIEENAICDGIPHCPFWDDEVKCPIACPQECKACSRKAYKCHAGSVRKIPQNAKSIDLSGQILNITELCAVSRISLSSLNISRCGLMDISCLFTWGRFPSLKHVDVSINEISDSIIGGWHMKINLDGNPVTNLRITAMEVNTLTLRNSNVTKVQWFYDKVRLKGYLCINCNLTDREKEDYCPDCKLRLCVRDFNLSGNSISNVRFINDCVFLVKIDVSHNKVASFGKRSYKLYYLQELYIHHNLLTDISPSVFHNMSALKIIDLGWNLIDSIQEKSFRTLVRLRILNLSFNQLRTLPATVFYNLISLHTLALQGNRFQDLPDLLFKDLLGLTTLDISKNNLKYLRNNLFEGLISLKNLDLRDNNIEAYETIFNRLGTLEHLYVQDFSLCCAKPKSVSAANCEAPRTIVSSCFNLVGSRILGVYVWLIAVFTFFGNASLIYSYLRTNETTNLFQIINYSIADLSLSLFFIIIAYKDVEIRGRYGFEDRHWKLNPWCDIAHVLYSISVEATTLFILIISVEQCKHSRLQLITECVLSVAVWCLSIIISVVPTIYSYHNNFKVGICINLPLSTFLKERSYSEFSVILHLLLNALISVCVIILNLYRSLRERRQIWFTSHGRSYNKCLNNLVIVLLVRNFIIYLTGFLVLYDVQLVEYDWIVLFMIPTCSLLSLIPRQGFKHRNNGRVLISKVFYVKFPAKIGGGTLIILIGIGKRERCLRFKDIGVLVTHEGTKQFYKPHRIRMIRNIILADFTENLGGMGEPTTLDVSIFAAGRHSISSKLTDL